MPLATLSICQSLIIHCTSIRAWNKNVMCPSASETYYSYSPDLCVHCNRPVQKPHSIKQLNVATWDRVYTIFVKRFIIIVVVVFDVSFMKIVCAHKRQVDNSSANFQLPCNKTCIIAVHICTLLFSIAAAFFCLLNFISTWAVRSS